MDFPSPVNLVVALQCEAKPLINALRLNGAVLGPYRIYQRDNIRLIVSGIGATQAAAAAAFLFASSALQSALWLNVGVAGHKTFERGRLVVADKVSDAASQRCWYPHLPVALDAPMAEVVSVARVQTQYHEHALYDMEASGFFASATRYADAAFVHSLKIVSDNGVDGVNQVSESLVLDLVATAMPGIVTIMESLAQAHARMSDWYQPPEQLEAFLQRWHFSVSQQYQLKRLLQGVQALGLHDALSAQPMDGYSKGTQVLSYLQTLVDSQAQVSLD